MRIPKATRLEVIDWTENAKFGGGRQFAAYDEDLEFEFSLQDDLKTIKVFIKDRNADTV